MRLLQSIKERGIFWNPETPKMELHGMLRISKSGRISLKVICDVSSYKLFTEFGQKYFRIIGKIENKKVTLNRCFITRSFNNHHIQTLDFCASIAFISSEHSFKDKIIFKEVIFSLEGLDEWIPPLKRDYDYDTCNDGKSRFLSLYCEYFKEIVIVQNDEMEVKLRISMDQDSFNHKSYISVIYKKPRSFEDYKKLIKKINNFFCFAMDKTVSINRVTGFPHAEEEVPMEILYRSVPRSKKVANVKSHNMLFRCPEKESCTKEIFSQWMGQYKELKKSFDWYFCATTRRGLLEHEIFSLVAALESLYKCKYLDRYENEEKSQTREFLDKKKGDFKLRNRLTILFKKEEPFRDFFDEDDDVENFIDHVISFRNNIAHGDNSPINDGNLEKYVKDLRNKLEALYKLYLLHSIRGIKGESLKKFVCENDRLRHQLGKEG